MRFLVDAQLPPRLEGWLRSLGHDADHLSELGLLDEPDDLVWRRALDANAVIVTKDRDFAEWALARDPAPQVLWLRMGNLANPSLIDRLEAAWAAIHDSLAAGDRVVEAGRP